MKRSTRAVGMTVLVVSGLLATRGLAAANPVQDYREFMAGIMPAVSNWSTEVQALAEAAAVKPDLACSTEMREMARRGQFIADDLAGTEPPLVLRANHARMLEALSEMAAAAESACGDAGSSAQRIGEAAVRLERAMAQIRFFARGPGLPGDRPNRPVLGN